MIMYNHIFIYLYIYIYMYTHNNHDNGNDNNMPVLQVPALPAPLAVPLAGKLSLRRTL